MTFSNKNALGFAAAMTVALLLGACTTYNQVVSSVTGDQNAAAAPGPNAGAGAVSSTPLPATAAAPQAVMSVPAGADTGTPVGQKVHTVRADMERLSSSFNQHNADLQRIRASLSGHASAYFSNVGAINSRLQVGAAPADPALMQQYGVAQGQLDGMVNDVAALNALSAEVSGDQALVAYCIQEIRAAAALQGGSDEDHRQLDALQAQANSDVVLIRQLSQAVADDLTRQNGDVTSERRKLAALGLAIKKGSGVVSQGVAPQQRAGSAGGALAAAAPASIGDRRPLVTIRFDRADVPYEQALYTAISRALDRRPSAVFDLVAVSPNAAMSTRARHDAEAVMRSLIKMGLPADRVAQLSMTNANLHENQVQIFVR